MILTDALCARYKEIDNQMKALEAEKQDLRKIFEQAGTSSTDSYNVIVSQKTRRTISLEKAIKALTEPYLREMGLINQSNYCEVKVAEKAVKQVEQDAEILKIG